MERMFRTADIPVRINRAGSLFTMFFTDSNVFNYETATQSNTELYARFFKGMLDRGIYLAPSAFEAAFVSFAHSDSDFEKTIQACAETIKTMGNNPFQWS